MIKKLKVICSNWPSFFIFPSFKAVVQQDPSFPPEMSPTSPLLSPQNSTSQTPLLQQAPPPGYQSPDMKSWQQTGIGSNRLGSSCKPYKNITFGENQFATFVYLPFHMPSLQYAVFSDCFYAAACSVSQDRVQGRPLASRGFTTTWASLSPWPEAQVVSAHYLPWGSRLAWATVTSAT